MRRNNLRAYVKRTILASAREYAYPAKRRTPDSTKSAFMDAMRGTDTGWWEGLIWTADVHDLFVRYRADALRALTEYLGETGQRVTDQVRPACRVTYADMLLALAQPGRPTGWDDDALCEAADLAIRFAVEWYAGEVAREYCPDL